MAPVDRCDKIIDLIDRALSEAPNEDKLSVTERWSAKRWRSDTEVDSKVAVGRRKSGLHGALVTDDADQAGALILRGAKWCANHEFATWSAEARSDLP
jgi:hypothetical protein